MSIKLFYNVPWYMHHDRLEARQSQSRGEGGGGQGGDGVDEELSVGVGGSVRNFALEFLVKQNCFKFSRAKSFCSLAWHTLPS